MLMAAQATLASYQGTQLALESVSLHLHRLCWPAWTHPLKSLLHLLSKHAFQAKKDEFFNEQRSSLLFLSCQVKSLQVVTYHDCFSQTAKVGYETTNKTEPQGRGCCFPMLSSPTAQGCFQLPPFQERLGMVWSVLRSCVRTSHLASSLPMSK